MNASVGASSLSDMIEAEEVIKIEIDTIFDNFDLNFFFKENYSHSQDRSGYLR